MFQRRIEEWALFDCRPSFLGIFWTTFLPPFRDFGQQVCGREWAGKRLFLEEPEEEREGEGKIEQRKGGIREFFLLTFAREELSQCEHCEFSIHITHYVVLHACNEYICSQYKYICDLLVGTPPSETHGTHLTVTHGTHCHPGHPHPDLPIKHT